MFAQDKKLMICFSSQRHTQQNLTHSQDPLLAWGAQNEKSQLLNLREMAAQGGNADRKPEQPKRYDTPQRLDIVGAQGGQKLESVSVALHGWPGGRRMRRASC